ncbi:MAG: Crp/Fnr family transcriptional regulator [Bacteroidales bacterium]|nr:Crp/Fnr family transcriptional regulator [Bacteroidales bacterium]
MKKLYSAALFEGLDNEFIDLLLDNKYRIRSYAVGEVVALQGDVYKSLLIVEEGLLKAEMIDMEGTKMVVEEIAAFRAVAPAFLFAKNNNLPVSIFAIKPSVIVSISKMHLVEMMQKNQRVLENYLREISDRSRFLSERLRLMTFGTIKSKLMNYFISLTKDHNCEPFTIPHTHQELADMFGVTRPALTRAIKQLEESSLISRTGTRTYRLHQ